SVFGGFDESSLMMDAAQHLRSYSPAVQAELKPFFVPPYYSASWWAIQRGKASTTSGGGASEAAGGSPRCGNPLTTWEHLDTTDGNFRIWWEAGSTRDAARAASMGSDLKGTIFPALAGLMAPGKSAPLGDSGGVCRGGSEAFDIALTGVDGPETLTDSFGC